MNLTHPITKMERFHTLYFNHTYRNFFIEEAGLMDWHFATSAKMVNNINYLPIGSTANLVLPLMN